jgi:hypothetical protein
MRRRVLEKTDDEQNELVHPDEEADPQKKVVLVKMEVLHASATCRID